jgi:hypothetical protein
VETPDVSQSEQELTRSIIEALTAVGICCWRNNVGTSRSGGRFIRFGKVGSGDIVCVLPGGIHAELEVKLPDGKWRVTPEQEAHGVLINRMGGLWACVTSVEDAMAVVHSWPRKDET